MNETPRSPGSDGGSSPVAVSEALPPPPDWWNQFHHLWTKAVGATDYVKTEWARLEGMLLTVSRVPRWQTLAAENLRQRAANLRRRGLTGDDAKATFIEQLAEDLNTPVRAEALPPGKDEDWRPSHVRCVDCGQRLVHSQTFQGAFCPECVQREVWTLEGAAPVLQPGLRDRPKIICLCGSTRFIETFAVKTWELELEGYIVLGCTLLPSWYCPVRDHFAETLGVKPQRDEHHLRKIDLADEVLVLNIGGYVGESTRNEIAYATAHGKPIGYVEPLAAPDPRGEPRT